MTRTRYSAFFVALSFVLLMIGSGVGLHAGQCFKGCPREWVEEGPKPDEALKTLVSRSRTIFVGTVSGVEPAVPVYPTGENVDWKAYDKVSEEFRRINEVTFAVESVWKGEKVDTIKLRGDNLLQIYRNTKKFLVFVEKVNKEGIGLDINKSVFGLVDVNHPDHHWDVDLGKKASSDWDKKSFRSDKRLLADYGPYVRKWDGNQHLWARGDTAYWSSSLKKDVANELAVLDPQFSDASKVNEVFLLTTRGCQYTIDEWDRTGGVGFIGWQPCPMPISLIQAYVKVLVKQGDKK